KRCPEGRSTAQLVLQAPCIDRFAFRGRASRDRGGGGDLHETGRFHHSLLPVRERIRPPIGNIVCHIAGFSDHHTTRNPCAPVRDKQPASDWTKRLRSLIERTSSTARSHRQARRSVSHPSQCSRSNRLRPARPQSSSDSNILARDVQSPAHPTFARYLWFDRYFPNPRRALHHSKKGSKSLQQCVLLR